MSKNRRKMRAIFSWLMVLCMVMTMGMFTAQTASADTGDTPAHSKTATDNEDGTYKLELSVTGDAKTEVETAANVNVLIVYDTSSSMTSNNVTTGPNRNRADYAEDVIHDFVQNLSRYQTGDGSNIQVAVVTFGPQATGRQTWTSNLTGNNGVNRFFDDGVDGTVTASHNYNQNNGTNWEAALRQAQTYLNALDTAGDTDPTFVILVTDGACTASGNGNNAINPNQPPNRPWTDFRTFYNAARDEAQAIEGRTDTTLFGIYAYGREADLLDDLMYYAQNGSDRTGMDGETDDTPQYYNANDTAALNAAIEAIFKTIVEALGVSSVSITDGTTNEVETSTGEISELLEVVEDSYQYWLSIPVNSDNQFQRIDLVSGETVTYTVSSDGKTVSWGSNSVTVNGEFVSEGGQRYLKYEWKEANALYDKAPPAASFEDGAVIWNLAPVGTLLDGVKYAVTFDVYPSQTTLDIVADIKNDPGEDGAWGDLDENIQKYIDVDGNLSTNTTATLKWVDTRDGSMGSSEYVNPDPVETTAVEQMAVTKEWSNEIDEQDHPPVTLTVTRDGEPAYEAVLSKDNPTPWTDSVFVSIGLMRTNDEGEMEVLEGAAGHDFTFTEPKDLSYHWELDVPVVHPMKIDGVTTMLVKVDDKHPAPSGVETYTINGAEYYPDEEAVALTALNERRSRVYLTKKVTGDNAPADAEFPFTIKIENSLAPEEEPTDDPNHNSDYWVWISARNKDGSAIEKVENAERGTGSWWYAPSGTDVIVYAKAGCSIMLNNLPSGTTYTITEGDMPAGFVYTETTLKADGQGTGEPFSGDRVTTGTVDAPNTEYTVTYSNEYAATDVTVKKVWDDANDQDGLRPKDLTLTLNGLPEGTTAPDPVITKSGNTWTYTWSGLPKKDASGQEITYTVTEDSAPSDYEVTGSPANPNGTITNKHEPKTVSYEVEKAWIDANDQDGLRPDSVKVQLYKTVDGKKSAYGDPVTLNEDGDWTYEWPKLPEKEGGKTITYSADETAVPSGYTKEVTTSDQKTTITNTHKTAEKNYTVKKVWDDKNDQDGLRPTSILVQLFAGEEAYGDPVELNEENDWTYTWKNLPVNQPVEGTTTEEQTPVGGGSAEEDEPVFTAVEVKDGAVTEETAAEEPAAAEETAVESEEAVEPEEAAAEPEEAAAEPEEAAAEPEEAADEAAAEPAATDEAVAEPAAATPIAYKAKEVEGSVPDVYTVSYTETDAGMTITNKYVPATTKLTVEKTWDDNSDEAGVRPSNATIQLYKTVKGKKTAVGKPVTVGSDKDTWKAEFTKLPVYEKGEPIEYSVEETLPSGCLYTVEIGDSVTAEPDDSGTIEITNTLNAVMSDPPVQKIVEGNPPTDDTFTFQMKAVTDGAPMPEGSKDGVKTVQITGNGSYEFGEMWFTEPGEWVYDISEINDGIKGYTYDTTVYNLTVTVTEGEDGKLVKEETVTANGGSAGDIVFTNVYEEEEPEPAPKTGDNAPTAMALLALLASGAALVLLRQRRKEER